MRVTSKTRAFGVTVGLVFAASLAPDLRATTFSLTLYNDYAGNAGIGGASGSAPGFGGSSWIESGSGKGEFYITPGQLFGYGVNVGQIASISYWTDKPGNSGSPDWSTYIYTAKTGSGDTGSFYHSRLTAEPYLTGSSVAQDPADTWTEWSTSGAVTNALTFYDAGRDGGILGQAGDPTLTQLQNGGGSYTWANSTSNNYNGEAIEYFSLQTGSQWANGFTGQVDGLTVTLKNGDVAKLNLESAPEPATIVLAGFAGVGILVARRRKKSA